MRPWEKRLRDLAKLLDNCRATYLDPDLFRMNTNQFLQTARTVTFLIQKNKETIPDYTNWYAHAVLLPWAKDNVMIWAKEARNTIEKEGDLDLNSSLRLTLVFSYLQEQDIAIECGKVELLNAGVKKLVRLAQKKLPSAVSDAAAVKIERRWITASLPDRELLYALVYVYRSMFECCQSLAIQLNVAIDESVPHADIFGRTSDEACQVSYFKVNGLRPYGLKTETLPADRKFGVPKEAGVAFDAISTNGAHPTNLDEALESCKKLAELTFAHFGAHDPMLLLFNTQWHVVGLISTRFADQVDKFLFWRHVADEIIRLEAYGLIWIAESWLRAFDRSGATPLRNMPITGEVLKLVGIDKLGKQREVDWQILREYEVAKPTLRLIPPTDNKFTNAAPYFLIPAMRALGITNPQFMTERFEA